MIEVTPRYEDDLWYPVLLKVQGPGYSRIAEMRGREINAWNDMVENKRLDDLKTYPYGRSRVLDLCGDKE